MKPLRDRSEPMSPIEASAVSLLRSVQPCQPPPEFKHRVRARLLASRPATRARLIRPAAVGVGALLLAAGASAAIAGTWVVRQYQASGSSPGAKAKLTPSPAASVLGSQGASQRALEPAAAAPEVVVQAEIDTPSIPEAQPYTRSNARSPTKASEQSKPSEQVKLVFDSMRALRRDGQPERAARLLDEYLRRYPGGALAEEALALSIEAATMLGDPRAKDMANRYLARYPNGQFQKAAERARARFSP
jgi:hypothetical protein